MTMPEEEFEQSFSLIMPFVTCASNGGPHDDDSFVAGYECGVLSTLLADGRPHWKTTVHAESLPQVDLIAMHRGYTVEADPPMEGWVRVVLSKVGADPTQSPEAT